MGWPQMTLAETPTPASYLGASILAAIHGIRKRRVAATAT